MCWRIFIFFTFLIFSAASPAQEIITLNDSIYNLKKKVYELKNKGDFEKAMTTLNSAVKFAEATENHKALVDFYNLYIQLHIEYSKYNRSTVYMTMAYSILSHYNYPDGKALTNAFEALTLIDKPEEAFSIIHNIKSNIVLEDENTALYIKYIEGIINFKTGNYYKAQQIFESLLTAEHEFEKEYRRSQILLQLARINHKTNKLVNGEIEASSALNIANEHDFPLVKMEANKILANIYEEIGNFENALHHYKTLTSIQNKTFSPGVIEANEDISAKTESDFFARILDQMNKDAIAQQQTVNISKLTSVLSSALLIIISLLTISLYRNNQIKYK